MSLTCSLITEDLCRVLCVTCFSCYRGFVGGARSVSLSEVVTNGCVIHGWDVVYAFSHHRGLTRGRRAQWACRGAPDPSAPQAASDFDPTSHADFGAATHPGVGGGTHRRSSRHLRALLSVCGRCSFGGLGCCSCLVCVCRCRGCCSLLVCVCVTC